MRVRRGTTRAALLAAWSLAAAIWATTWPAVEADGGREQGPQRPGVRTPQGGGVESSPPAAERAGRIWESGAGIRLVWIPGGEFEMGAENGWDNERPVHRVRLTRGFWLGETEVTQATWRRVMGSNPSRFKGCPACPVEMVSWEDCQAFVRRLNERYPVGGGLVWRLPYEAEWEYACRAGTRGDYYGGDGERRLAELGWYEANNNVRPRPVKRKQPNGWGLYDMHGNVAEWCADWYGGDYYRSSPAEDPRGPEVGDAHVLRGGSWCESARYCRAAARTPAALKFREEGSGLRVAVGAP